MSDLVDRLAGEWLKYSGENGQYQSDTRWWLNAIADELRDNNQYEGIKGVGWNFASRWLRPKAGEEA